MDIDPEIGRVGTSRPGLVSPNVSVRAPQPAQVVFRDPEGNRFLLVEVPRRSSSLKLVAAETKGEPLDFGVRLLSFAFEDCEQKADKVCHQAIGTA